MRRRLLPVLFAVALGAVAPLPVMGQSNETCIAYMEADHDYGRAETAARASPPYQAAKAACRKTTLKAIEAAGQGVESPAFKNAEKASRKACEARESVLDALVEPALERKAKAYIAAYKGPTSREPNITTKLIRADRERCRRRLE